MCEIGLIDEENNVRFEDIKDTRIKKLLPSIINEKSLNHYLENLDGFIIVEPKDKGVGYVSEIIIKVKQSSNKFIWVIANDDEISKIIYLQLGCDGVFEKKVSMEQLSLYIKNMLRRFKTELKKNYADRIGLNPQSFSITIEGIGEVLLTKKEYQIFELLYENEGKTVSYEELVHYAWANFSDTDKRYRVANIIFHLRNKLKIDIIKTIRHKGYMFLDK